MKTEKANQNTYQCEDCEKNVEEVFRIQDSKFRKKYLCSGCAKGYMHCNLCESDAGGEESKTLTLEDGKQLMCQSCAEGYMFCDECEISYEYNGEDANDHLHEEEEVA